MIELIKQIIEQDGLGIKNRKREIIHRKIYLFNALRKEGYTLKKLEVYLIWIMLQFYTV